MGLSSGPVLCMMCWWFWDELAASLWVSRSESEHYSVSGVFKDWIGSSNGFTPKKTTLLWFHLFLRDWAGQWITDSILKGFSGAVAMASARNQKAFEFPALFGTMASKLPNRPFHWGTKLGCNTRSSLLVAAACLRPPAKVEYKNGNLFGVSVFFVCFFCYVYGFKVTFCNCFLRSSSFLLVYAVKLAWLCRCPRLVSPWVWAEG